MAKKVQKKLQKKVKETKKSIGIRLSQEIANIVKQSPGGKMTVREICHETHISYILTQHLRCMQAKGEIHFESEGEVGLDTIVTVPL